MGESKTPLALTRACNKFIHLNLIDASDKDTGHKDVPEDNNENNVTSIDEIENAILALLNESGDGNAGLTAYTQDGKAYTLSDMKGKVVVIDFWFTGCIPCRAEMPYFDRLAETFKDRPVQFLSVSLDTGDH